MCTFSKLYTFVAASFVHASFIHSFIHSFMNPPTPHFPFTLLNEWNEKYSGIRAPAWPPPPPPLLLGLYYLNQVPGQKLRLAGGDAVVQHVPALAQAELHDVMLDRCCVIGRRDPCEQDSLLRAIGCEAPWLGKQHQWLWGTYRKNWTKIETRVVRQFTRMEIWEDIGSFIYFN